MNRNLSFFLVLCMLLFVSCKKKSETTASPGTPGSNFAIPVEQQKVIDFLSTYHNELYNPSNKSIKKSKAMWIWDASFNYEYCSPDVYTESMLYDTFLIEFPVVNEFGCITQKDLFSTYEKIIEHAREYFTSLEQEKKTLKYIIVNELDKNLQIVLAVGSAKKPKPFSFHFGFGLPFAETEDWPWGPGGRGIQNGKTGDAAFQLTNAISTYDYFKSKDKYGRRLWIYNVKSVEYQPKNPQQDWWLFQMLSETDNVFINGKDLNNYYQSNMEKTHYTNELSTYFETKQPYFSAEVIARKQKMETGFWLYHSLKVNYATKILVSNKYHVTL